MKQRNQTVPKMASAAHAITVLKFLRKKYLVFMRKRSIGVAQ